MDTSTLHSPLFLHDAVSLSTMAWTLDLYKIEWSICISFSFLINARISKPSHGANTETSLNTKVACKSATGEEGMDKSILVHT
jgi:hypothetical protein